MNELTVEKDGKVELPTTFRRRAGLDSRPALLVSETPEGILLRSADPPATKVYVEPTTRCNLSCRTCMRNSWAEQPGEMPIGSYRRLLKSLAEFPSIETVGFWGFGEPLLHPNIVEMVSLAHSQGIKSELVTNGLLLSRKLAEELVAAGLQTLVVSVDGTTPESFGDARVGADLQQVFENISHLRAVKYRRSFLTPEIGIEFVAMRSNMSQLPRLPTLAYALGASFVIVTNVRSTLFPEFKLPPIDLRSGDAEDILSLMRRRNVVNPPLRFSTFPGDYCPFVNQGSLAVSWDGGVSPCVALMHSYTCYILGRQKFMKRYVVGSIEQKSLLKMWNRQDYKDFRKRVVTFAFSPCLHCGGCDYAESKQEDCFGNPFPVCGDCLWARGIILCP